MVIKKKKSNQIVHLRNQFQWNPTDWTVSANPIQIPISSVLESTGSRNQLSRAGTCQRAETRRTRTRSRRTSAAGGSCVVGQRYPCRSLRTWRCCRTLRAPCHRPTSGPIDSGNWCFLVGSWSDWRSRCSVRTRVWHCINFIQIYSNSIRHLVYNLHTPTRCTLLSSLSSISY